MELVSVDVKVEVYVPEPAFYYLSITESIDIPKYDPIDKES